MWAATLSVLVRSYGIPLRGRIVLCLHIGPEVAQQVGAAAGITPAIRCRQDAVGPERAERRPLLAPGAEHPGTVHETQLNRPDRAMGLPPLPVDIVDLEPTLPPDRRPEVGQRHGIFGKAGWRP